MAFGIIPPVPPGVAVGATGYGGLYAQYSRSYSEYIGVVRSFVSVRGSVAHDVFDGSRVEWLRDGAVETRRHGVDSGAGNDVVDAVSAVHECVAESKAEVGVSRDSGVCVDAPGFVLGPNGGESFGRGKNYQRNLLARESRKKKKRKEKVSSESSLVKSALQMSLEAKWESENKLAKVKADRQLELLEARDLESEKKMQRAQIMRTTEAAKVQTERAYATLRRTGNVPGFAETVVASDSGLGSSPGRSDGTCISPDSSVSQQEIRAMMKELEDYKLTLSRIERDNPALVAHHMEGHGVKTAFTLDSDGMCPVDEPGCMGIDGKYHLDSYEPNPKFYRDRFRAEEATERYFNRE